MAELEPIGPRLLLEDCTSRPLRTEDGQAVRGLCAECFPINYPESWYNYVVSNKVCLNVASLVSLPPYSTDTIFAHRYSRLECSVVSRSW